ncbi:MAG: hypothetical protein AB7K71_40420, partial [Polyangiaceae bacterium]
MAPAIPHLLALWQLRLAPGRREQRHSILLAAHIRWGKSDAGREPELRLLAEWVHTRTQEQFLGDKDLIVLGDFNIPAEQGPLFDAITSKGLRMPAALLGQPGSNLARNKRYDALLVGRASTGATPSTI